MKYYMSLLVLGIAIGLNTAGEPRNSVEEFFWRDYNGLMPNDALIGGQNQLGINTYVAQMSVNINSIMNFVPATAIRGSKIVTGTSGGKVLRSNNNSNVKILCTRSSTKYFWHSQSSIVSPNCRYVVAGQENLVPLYLGKAKYRNETLVGKIFSDERFGKTVFIPYGNSELISDDYTTLMHCP